MSERQLKALQTIPRRGKRGKVARQSTFTPLNDQERRDLIQRGWAAEPDPVPAKSAKSG